MKSWGTTPKGEKGDNSPSPSTKKQYFTRTLERPTVDSELGYIKIPWLRNGKRKAVNILVQMLVLNLRPESKTLGSLFPV